MLNHEGILPALITPMSENGLLMADSFESIINYTIEGGVHGLFVLGSTGESYGISPDEKIKIIDKAIEINNSRVPVYIGVGGITTNDSIKAAITAEKAGADAVSVLTPYFISPNYSELKDHFKSIASSVKIPVLLYNNIGRTNVGIPTQMVKELSEIENIVGIKDSSGDLSNMADYIRLTDGKDFSVFSGRDTLILSNLHCGGKGAVAATAGIAPKLVVSIYDAFTAGKYDEARKYQNKLTVLRNAFSLTTFPGFAKECLNIMGFNVGSPLLPVGPMSEENRRKTRSILEDLDLLN